MHSGNNTENHTIWHWYFTLETQHGKNSIQCIFQFQSQRNIQKLQSQKPDWLRRKPTFQICYPCSVLDCHSISESIMMKWYTPAWDHFNPKTSFLEKISFSNKCMCNPLLRSLFIILFNDKTLNLDLQSDQGPRLDFGHLRSTIMT